MATGLPENLSLANPLRAFARATSTQDQAHIRPMHAYVALRLVTEGGFLPDEVTPHPPLRSRRLRDGRHQLTFDADAETDKERTIVGGLKSKRVDVVACKEGLGPVLCVSLKGTGNAFRNLTNRMEEAIGDRTNVHIMYPGLVYGFMHLLKANRAEQEGMKRNDISVLDTGETVPAVMRYHDLLCDLAGRKFVRNDLTRYESVALLMIESALGSEGQVFEAYPPADSPLQVDRFFRSLYDTYDLRFPFIASNVRSAERVVWDSASPALAEITATCGEDMSTALGYLPRTD